MRFDVALAAIDKTGGGGGGSLKVLGFMKLGGDYQQSAEQSSYNRIQFVVPIRLPGAMTPEEKAAAQRRRDNPPPRRMETT